MSEAPAVHEFQIRESDPWYGDFVTAEGETWFVFAHEFKAYREWADQWKRVAERSGVCITCALGAPDISIGCTDCLNTGFAHGAPQGYVSEGFHEEEVGKLQRRLENRQDTINVLEEIIAKKERSCGRKKDDGAWDLSGPCLTCGAADEHICGRGARGYIANPTALAEAEARGRRQGLEEAAKHFDGLAAAADAKTMAAWTDTEAGEGIRAMGEAKRAAKAVRNLLATTPAETQKPEETH